MSDETLYFGADHDGRLVAACCDLIPRKELCEEVGSWVVDGYRVHRFDTREAYLAWYEGLI